MMLKTIPQWLRAVRLTRLKAGGGAEIVRTRAQSWCEARVQADVEHAGNRQDTAALYLEFRCVEHALAIDNSRSTIGAGRLPSLLCFSVAVAIVLKIASQYCPQNEPWPAEPH